MLLDIFATKTNNELSTGDASMKELLMRHLDKILISEIEFMRWYDEASNRISAI